METCRPIERRLGQRPAGIEIRVHGCSRPVCAADERLTDDIIACVAGVALSQIIKKVLLFIVSVLPDSLLRSNDIQDTSGSLVTCPIEFD